ncbi:MAG: hypothetical protein ACJATP_003213 [Candidatus Azotimanducaceae bacterium]|jgi:hypothetical protein
MTTVNASQNHALARDSVRINSPIDRFFARFLFFIDLRTIFAIPTKTIYIGRITKRLTFDKMRANMPRKALRSLEKR